MVVRKLSLKIYLLALIITVAIFLLGVFVGGIVDTQVSEDLRDEIRFFSGESTTFEVLMLLEDSSSFCPLYIEEAKNLEDTTIEIGDKLTFLEEQKGVYDNELKKQYFLLETKAFLLSKKVNELCGEQTKPILYFYSQECSKCSDQARVLGEVASEVDNLRIYSFDGKLGSAVASSLMEKYSVNQFPSLVVGNQTFSGFTSKDELLNSLQE